MLGHRQPCRRHALAVDEDRVLPDAFEQPVSFTRSETAEHAAPLLRVGVGDESAGGGGAVSAAIARVEYNVAVTAVRTPKEQRWPGAAALKRQ